MSGQSIEETLRLVEAAQGGDERALNKLFERYLPRTRRIVACRMGWRLTQVEEYEDLVQETLLRVFRGLERFEARSEGSFRRWVAHLVECAIRDAARRATRAKRGGGAVQRWGDLADDTLSSSIFASETPTPSAIASASETEERIERCLQKLPERYRELIVLRSLCGMSYEEIAESMGVDRVATIRMACSRAVQRLAELMGE